MPPKRSRRVAAPSTDAEQHEQPASTSTSHEQQSQPSIDSNVAAADVSSASSVHQPDTLPRPVLPSSAATNGRPARPATRPRGVGRRSQQGRAELEKIELERKQAEAASRPQVKPWQRRDAQRGRGTVRGRQRGGYAGESMSRAHEPEVVSGPFSLGQVSKPSKQGGRGSAAGGGGRSVREPATRRNDDASAATSSSQRVKQESSYHGDVGMSDFNIEDGGYISSDADDERPAERKVNVDQLVDLTGEDDAGEDLTSIPPIRIQRYEHKERTGLASADGATRQGNDPSLQDTYTTEKRKGRPRPKDPSTNSFSNRYKGTYTDSESEDEVLVKQEHADLAHPGTGSPPTSPEMRRKAKAGIRAGSFGAEVQRPAFQTKEEEIEWSIHQRDLRILQSELGSLTLPNDAADDPRADKMYLFQLPAILPPLAPVNPKQEDGDVVMQDVPEHGATKAPAVKTEAGSAHPQAKQVAPSGMVGKLRVHKSGRAYLDWGGIPMEVSMGQETSFLQDVVIVDAKDTPAAPRPDNTEQDGGTVISMGQVKGRFVVVPHWDAIFDQLY